RRSRRAAPRDGDLFGRLLREARRPGVLRSRSHGGFPPIRRLCGSHLARRETRRSSVPAADQVRAHDQPHSRQSARPRIVAGAARACRRGDRMMRRRSFITLLGGAASWPLAARAQQPAVPVIGFLNPSSPDGYRLRAFHQGLKEAGFVEGENVAIEYRWADNQFDRLPTLAAELVRRRVTVLVAGGGFRSGLAAKMETKSIPVLFIAAEDPVKLGLVTSLAKPDGNLTGINILLTEVVAKRLELLRELLPKANHIAVLADSANA